MLQKLRRNNQKGFTLIELMIVIAIIGILAAIAIPNFLEYRKKGQDSAANRTGQNFIALTMAYWSDTGPGTFTASADDSTIKYNIDADSEAGGDITMNDNGVVTGTATFSHTNSSQTYTLYASDGHIE